MNQNGIQNDHGFIGSGIPYFYPADGDSEALYFGNPVTAAIAISSETKTRKSRRKHDFGAILDSVTTPNPPELTIGTDAFQPLNWAMAMMGTSAHQTVNAETVADEAAKARLSGYHQLAHGDIDPATVEVKKGGSAIDKSKYTLEPDMGLLQIIDSSAAAEGDDLTVNYQTKDVTKTVIDGARVSSFRGKIVIDGRDEVTGKRARLIMPNVNIAVDGDFDWYSEDFNTVTMKGSLSVGPNGEAPYTVELYD